MLAPCASAQSSDGVILLHGLVRTTASMEKMKAALTESGYVVANINYPSQTATINTLDEDTISAALNSASLRDCTLIYFVTTHLAAFSRAPISRNTPTLD